LITFIFCPEVLGIHRSLEEWFHKSKQVYIVIIYLIIVLLYCAGFAWVFFQLANDPIYPGAFDLGNAGKTTFGTFFYFSIITFAAIGYGDISPLSGGARLVSCVEGILGMMINVVFIAILLMYISNVQTIVHKERQLARSDKEIKEKAELLEKQIKNLSRKKQKKK
jgi:amino acid transporter